MNEPPANDAASPPDAERLRRAYRTRFVLGCLLLLAGIVPAVVHSAASIRTLRNIPVLWLPESLPVRQEFFAFVERFAVPDVVFVSWPSARLGHPSVETAERWLAPLTEEASALEASAVPADDLPSAAKRVHRQIRDAFGGVQPIVWLRSGEGLIEQLTARPLSLSPAEAKLRLRGSLLGPDGEQTCLVLSLAPAAGDEHQTLLQLLREGLAEQLAIPQGDIAMVGGPVDGVAIDRAAIRSIERFSIPSSIVAAILCVVCLRSWVLSATIIAIAMVGQGMSLALVYYAGYSMNAILIILPALVFVLSVSSGIHLSNYFRETRKQHPQESSALVAAIAMRTGMKPCLYSAATTVVGLLSLALVRLEPVHVFGVVAAIGIAGTLAMQLLMLPGAMLMSRLPATEPLTESAASNVAADRRCAGRRTLGRRIRDADWIGWPLRNRRFVIAAFACLTAAAAAGLPYLESSVSVPELFDEDSDLRRQYAWFERNLGPTVTGEVLLTFPVDSQADPLAKFAAVTKVHSELVKLEGVGGVMSAATYLPRIPQRRSLAAIGTRTTIRRLIDESPLLSELGTRWRDEREETWRVTFRLYQTDSEPFSGRIAAVERTARAAIAQLALPAGVEGGGYVSPQLALTGHIVVVQKSQEILLQDLFRSFLAAFVIIALFMAAMVGSLWGGLLSMIPNLIPTLMLFGMMGWLNYPLDIGAVMTASVALGIAVDDTLHLLSHFRDQSRRAPDRWTAARASLRQCGLAMLHTTLICGCSLLVYVASEFVPTRRFAIFMAVLLSMAWLGVAVLLPALMVTPLGRWLGGSKIASRNALASGPRPS